MPKRASAHPTELELQILQSLWEESPLPVGQVQEKLASGRARRSLTYSTVITVLNVLNVMVRKKYLRRKKQGKAFLYSPLLSEEHVSQSMLGDIVDRVFDGSTSSVMMNLLEKGDMESEELKEIRRMINRIVRRESPADADPQVSRLKFPVDGGAGITKSLDSSDLSSESRLSQTERALIGTWQRSSFLNQTTLTFTPERTYQYEHSITGANPRSGEWKLENGTELVYLKRNSSGSVDETMRSRIVSVNETELKLQQLSSEADAKVDVFELNVNDDNPNVRRPVSFKRVKARGA